MLFLSQFWFSSQFMDISCVTSLFIGVDKGISLGSLGSLGSLAIMGSLCSIILVGSYFLLNLTIGDQKLLFWSYC